MKSFLPLKLRAATALIFVALFQFSCSKDSNSHTLGTVVTNSIIAEVTTTTAISGGAITSIGSDVVTATGVCYSATSQTPAISDSHTSDNVSSNGFSSSLTGLTPGATYYVRAYVTNAAGTAYGSVVKFTTPTAGNSTVATVTTFAGSGAPGLVNAMGTGAQFYNPQGIAVDAQGNMYVCDQFNHVIRKITSAGIVTTFCGNGTLGHADGPAATAEFYSPNALALDATGNVYVIDQGNNVVVKITPDGVATTIAGSGLAGYVNSSIATNALFNGPKGIALNTQGDIYVADSGNNRIRKITTAGVVSTIAGAGSGFTDSTGTNALFNNPSVLAFNSKGVLYVADYNNHAIRTINSTGSVRTLARTMDQIALVGNPLAITFDANDNLYIADGAGRVLRLTASTNVLNTLAGSTGTYGFAEGTGSSVQFNIPSGIAAYGGNLYVADYNNNRIRKIAVTN